MRLFLNITTQIARRIVDLTGIDIKLTTQNHVEILTQSGDNIIAQQQTE